jgi:hypothetical protein
MDNSYIDNINLDLDDLFAMNYDSFDDNNTEDKLEMSEQIIRGIEDVIINILPINDEYEVTFKQTNEFTIFKFKKVDVDFSIKIIINTSVDRIHFIDVDVFINDFKIKTMLIHNEFLIRDLKDFLTFIFM